MGTVPNLSAALAQKEEAARSKGKPATHIAPRLLGELIEDKAEICIVLDKQRLLEALGPGSGSYRTQEGVNITADGEFTFEVDGKKYKFHLRLFPAWARVDMVVQR